jgi:hypothetical protein
VGKVGTGFNDTMRKRLNNWLWSHLQPRPVIACKHKGHWVEAKLGLQGYLHGADAEWRNAGAGVSGIDSRMNADCRSLKGFSAQQAQRSSFTGAMSTHVLCAGSHRT